MKNVHTSSATGTWVKRSIPAGRFTAPSRGGYSAELTSGGQLVPAIKRSALSKPRSSHENGA